MAECEGCASKDNLTFVNRIIHNAFRYAGWNRSNNTLSGSETKDGIQGLNEILSSWGQANHYIFFETRFQFTAIANQAEYIISNLPTADIQTNPFISIDYITYTVGDINYNPKVVPFEDIDSIPFDQTTNYPVQYAYRIENGFTRLKFFPRPTGSEFVTINGRQQLSNVNLFQDASDVIPAYAVQALTYKLAEKLAILYSTTPSPGFKDLLTEETQLFLSSNQRSMKLEAGPTPNFGSWYRYWGGGYY